MLGRSFVALGGAVGRKKASAAAKAITPKTKKPVKSVPVSKRKKSPPAKLLSEEDYSTRHSAHLTRPAYMTEEREKEVLQLAVRMQGRDVSGEVPVASYAYEIIQKHPSVRAMGLRERMDFLCTRWDKLSRKEKLKYLNDPLKGLM